MIKRKHPLAQCEKCPLYKRDYVPTSGPANAEVAFVSRSPGYYDSLAREPFSGPSGRVLDHLLESNGTTRKRILTTNVVLCHDEGEPPQDAIDACKPRLDHEIMGCKTVIAGGVEAVHTLINERWAIKSARGRVHNGPPVPDADGKPTWQRRIATTNPAVVLRESGNYPDMVRDFRLALNPASPPVMPKVWYTEDADEAIEFLKSVPDQVGSNTYIASDLETFGYTSKIACAGFAWATDMAYVIGYTALQDQWVMEELRRLYGHPLLWTWHNGKYDIKVLRQNGIHAEIIEDTFLMSYALDERPGGNYQGDQGAGLHALTPTLMQVYGWPDYEHASVKEFKKTSVLENPLELYDYNGKDTVGTLVLLEDFLPACKADDVYDRPYVNTFIPLANALVQLELQGFCYDAAAAADTNERVVYPRLRQLISDMRSILGLELYNPNSHVQNKGIFYERYGLKHGLQDTKKHIKSTSSDKDVRKEILEGRFECKPGKATEFRHYVELLEEYLKIAKQKNAFIESLIDKVQPDGKLYSTFKFGTETGRLSSEKPNFQQITRAGVYGLPSMRDFFTASPGNKLISVDLSQAELRTIAKLSAEHGPPNLLSIYRETNRSLHKERAVIFYGEDYTYEEYVKTKNINFGVTYGQSAFTFAQMYNMPQDEAQAYIDKWFEDFPEITAWIEYIKGQVNDTGVIVSPFGHKRRFHLLTKENRDETYKQAVNFIPQNVAGVLTEHALIELLHDGVPCVTSTHDSIVADVPSGEVEQVALHMQAVLEAQSVKQLGWSVDDIPFTADISVGDVWGKVEEVQLGKDRKVAA